MTVKKKKKSGAEVIPGKRPADLSGNRGQIKKPRRQEGKRSEWLRLKAGQKTPTISETYEQQPTTQAAGNICGFAPQTQTL